MDVLMPAVDQHDDERPRGAPAMRIRRRRIGHEAEPHEAWAVNVEATRRLLDAVRIAGLLHDLGKPSIKPIDAKPQK